MGKRRPLTEQEVQEFCEVLEDISHRARDISERLFQSLGEDTGSPIKALRTVTMVQERLAGLAQRLAAKAGNEEDARTLRADLEAQVRTQA